MSTVPFSSLVRALQAVDRALDDDRAKRITLPKETYMALLRASGELQTHIERLQPAEVAVEA
jgi:hypothetical protein